MIEQKVLHIKNMVCNRCIKSVTDVLCELGIEHKSVLLGEVELTNPIDASQKEELKNTFQASVQKSAPRLFLPK